MSYQEASPPESKAQRRSSKFTPDRNSADQSSRSARRNLRTDRCDYWSHRGHTERYLLKAGHQFTTTEG